MGRVKVRKWKKLSGFGTIFKFDKKGDHLEGEYLKSETIKIDGRPARQHHIQRSKGDVVTVMGTVLNALEKLPKGTPVRIVYTGTADKPSRKGFAPARLFDIEIPDDVKVKD